MKNAYLLLSVFQAISFFFPELYSDIPAGKQRTVWYEQKLQAQLGNSIWEILHFKTTKLNTFVWLIQKII